MIASLHIPQRGTSHNVAAVSKFEFPVSSFQFQVSNASVPASTSPSPKGFRTGAPGSPIFWANLGRGAMIVPLAPPQSLSTNRLRQNRHRPRLRRRLLAFPQAMDLHPLLPSRPRIPRPPTDSLSSGLHPIRPALSAAHHNRHVAQAPSGHIRLHSFSINSGLIRSDSLATLGLPLPFHAIGLSLLLLEERRYPRRL